MVRTLLPAKALPYVTLCLFVTLGLLGLQGLQHQGLNLDLRGTELVGLGFIGTWRWSWLGLQLLRSRFYLHWVFPRWRKQADQIPVEDLPPVCFLVPTYKEKPWITERVFRAIAREAKTLTHPITVLVNSSSDEENQAIREILLEEDPDLTSIHLIEMIQYQGKRKAMADSLRHLASLNLPENAIVALMDGDSEITPGTLRQCLSFFQLFPDMGALTTDEIPIVEGSYLFSEWFHLRMAQRHYQMCSLSLSQKVLCLTGRFSLFRAEAALDPTFADILECDTLDDWLWGNFKFLSGDDKSTWYWLLRRGYKMLYVPDAIVYSIETISGSLWNRAYQNMRRWYGNMLRNSDRALALGPLKTGWFIWWCLLDQRISIWTSLITPSFLILSVWQQNWWIVGFILCWILCTRPLYLSIIFSAHTSTLKPLHLPLLLASQWSASVVKVWTQMNLAHQKWANRGNQLISAYGTGWERVMKLAISRFLLLSNWVGFVVILCGLSGLIYPLSDLSNLPSLWQMNQASESQNSIQVIAAIDHHIFPNDGQDDAVQLQTLIDQAPSEQTIQMNLPMGELDLFQPLEINRSNFILHGAGIGKTILQSHFSRELSPSILNIAPDSEQSQWIQNLSLIGLTLRHAQSNPQYTYPDNLVLDRVKNATLERLSLETEVSRPLVLQETQEIVKKYLAIETQSDVISEL